MSGVDTCCPNCFGDRGLAGIMEGLKKGRGKCPICLTEGTPLVLPSALREVFGPLFNIYEPAANGRMLVDWLREDWDLFHHERMEDVRAKELLAEIMDDGDIGRKPVAPSPKYQSDRLLKWETLRAELMHENRYFPTTKLEFERLDELLELLQAEKFPTDWCRARLQTEDAPFPLDKMGAPPPRIASHGRANPAGIPYLYLGSDPDTAVAEIRPHTGEMACVAYFEVPDTLQLVDLCNPRRVLSPFAFADEDLIGRLRSDVAFLQRLGDELTRPVVPQGAPFDYVPSQYLCEYIKRCEYDGVLYSSSVGEGINLALFKPDLARPISVDQYAITNVTASIKLVLRR